MQNIEISKLELEILINSWDETSLLTIHSDIFEFVLRQIKTVPRQNRCAIIHRTEALLFLGYFFLICCRCCSGSNW